MKFSNAAAVELRRGSGWQQGRGINKPIWTLGQKCQQHLAGRVTRSANQGKAQWNIVVIVTIDFVIMMIFVACAGVVAVIGVAVPMRVNMAVMVVSMGVVDMPRVIVMRVSDCSTEAVRSRGARDQAEHGQATLHHVSP